MVDNISPNKKSDQDKTEQKKSTQDKLVKEQNQKP